MPDDSIQDIEELIERTIRERPRAVSALLLALAVERDLISAREAEQLARGVGLDDLQTIKEELAIRLDELGRTGELAGLLTEGRRVLQRARRLLG
jgi:hypothetical protein